jgi:hypothetical protein
LTSKVKDQQPRRSRTSGQRPTAAPPPLAASRRDSPVGGSPLSESQHLARHPPSRLFLAGLPHISPPTPRQCRQRYPQRSGLFLLVLGSWIPPRWSLLFDDKARRRVTGWRGGRGAGSTMGVCSRSVRRAEHRELRGCGVLFFFFFFCALYDTSGFPFGTRMSERGDEPSLGLGVCG